MIESGDMFFDPSEIYRATIKRDWIAIIEMWYDEASKRWPIKVTRQWKEQGLKHASFQQTSFEDPMDATKWATSLLGFATHLLTSRWIHDSNCSLTLTKGAQND